MKKFIITLSFICAALVSFSQTNKNQNIFTTVKSFQSDSLNVASLGANVEVVEGSSNIGTITQQIEIGGCSQAIARRLLASGYFDLTINNAAVYKNEEKVFIVNGINLYIKVSYVITAPKETYVNL